MIRSKWLYKAAEQPPPTYDNFPLLVIMLKI